jgi:hypothetical protein
LLLLYNDSASSSGTDKWVLMSLEQGPQRLLYENSIQKLDRACCWADTNIQPSGTQEKNLKPAPGVMGAMTDDAAASRQRRAVGIEPASIGL